ncbi:MAG: carbohydrate porin [Rhodospirillales bacterium]|nr:carbohydrate porin [Rhodospirillales bacterium]USO07899.1 MAG: carbohydrate porin [Rhodospirillales bacterium]
MLSFSIIACSCPGALAQDEKPNFQEEKLTGDWGGLRSRLYDAGLSLDAYYKFDLWRNFSGGIGKGNRGLDNLDLQATLDGEKALGIQGLTLFAYLLNNDGGRPNTALVGSNGGIDNIETGNNAFKLYELWAEQNFWGDRVSVLAGLHDLNSEFYITDTSGLFLNPTYGIGTEMAATGDNGPSIFPTTSLGVRINVKPTDNTYIKAAIFDGVPGNVNNGRGTHIQFKKKDGALDVIEGGLDDENLGKLAVGVWQYTGKRADQQTGNPATSKGYYFLGDHSFYNQDGKDISAFARIGFTAGDVESFKSNWSFGAVMSGFIPNRADGQLGLAVTRVRNSDKFVAANAPVDRTETQWELTYADKLLPWLSIQPDLQYTVNPGTDPNLKNAWTGGIRLGVDF